MHVIVVLVVAEHFFIHFWPNEVLDPLTGPWENLQSLALTSRLLHPEADSMELSKLLIAAARAASFMPKLDIIEM